MIKLETAHNYSSYQRELKELEKLFNKKLIPTAVFSNLLINVRVEEEKEYQEIFG